MSRSMRVMPLGCPFPSLARWIHTLAAQKAYKHEHIAAAFLRSFYRSGHFYNQFMLTRDGVVVVCWSHFCVSNCSFNVYTARQVRINRSAHIKP